VLIGGGRLGRVDAADGVARTDPAGLAAMARTARELFPIMRRARIVRCWAGIEGRTPDGIPVIGPSAAAPGVFHAFGFSLHGFQLGPVVGEILADLAADGRTAHPIGPFSIARFADRQTAAGGDASRRSRIQM
jgi:sarcosine oxidase subunit beta